MSTLGSILSTARNALQVHQKTTQVVSHNLSNVQTEGYSRQRTELTTGSPLRTPQGMLGGGVRIADITRARDPFLDITVRREFTSAAGARLMQSTLGKVESAFLEPGEQGLGASLDAFWSAWSDLANGPSNGAARALVRDRGEQLAGHLHRLDAEIDETIQLSTRRLDDAVGNLNRLAQNIADLNRQIISAEVGGITASDLRDDRDRALDQLARLLPVQITERENGGMGVSVGGITIVDDVTARPVEVRYDAAARTYSVQSGSGSRVQGEEGEIGALLKLVNEELPRFRGQLDELARALVHDVNQLHAQGVSGVDANGDPAKGALFFDDQGGDLSRVTARNIRISGAIAADPSRIAVGTGGASTNDVALALAQLRHSAAPTLDPAVPNPPYLGNQTLGAYYSDLVSALGLAVASAEDAATVHETLGFQAEIRRESVSGVSTDEEMVRLIQTQAAYGAAARVITTVDEMLQTLLRL